MATKTHEIRTIREVRHIVKRAETHKNHEFRLHEKTALNDARQLWGIVSNTGGHGVFRDVDLLAGKDEAFQFVHQNLEKLRRLVEGSDKRIEELVAVMDRLEVMLGAGGPGLPSSYEPKAYRGDDPFLDVDQEIEDVDLDGHIDAVRALRLQTSPVTPPTKGRSSEENLKRRERLEQRAATQFNLALLRMKRDVLAEMRANIVEGIAELEDKFLSQPTYLGCGRAEYVKFEDMPLLPEIQEDSEEEF